MLNQNNNIKYKIFGYEFNRIEYYKNLKQNLKQVFNKRAQIFYILDGTNKVEHAYREFMYFKHKVAIYDWTHGLVTNFSEVLKNYIGNRGKFRQENLFNLKWNKINTLVLSKLPINNPSLLNELLILKQALNIKIVGFVNLDSHEELLLCKTNTNLKDNVSLIDLPLYYRNSDRDIDKKMLYMHVFKAMTKAHKK